MLQQLVLFQKEIFETATKKGFWEIPNLGEKVMLIVSELGECLEAHRKGKNANTYLEPGNTNEDYLNSKTVKDFKHGFLLCIKDSYQDEIADVIIRILDYCAYSKFPLYVRDFRKDFSSNFGEDLLTITQLCLDSHRNVPGKDWGYTIAAIIKFCEWYEIDLIKHIQWKMRYNSTRPYKHGKKY